MSGEAKGNSLGIPRRKAALGDNATPSEEPQPRQAGVMDGLEDQHFHPEEESLWRQVRSRAAPAPPKLQMQSAQRDLLGLPRLGWWEEDYPSGPRQQPQSQGVKGVSRQAGAGEGADERPWSTTSGRAANPSPQQTFS